MSSKKINIIQFKAFFLLLLIFASIAFYFIYNTKEDESGTTQFICGTENFRDVEGYSEGRKLFVTNCVACHKLDAKSVGPALRGVTDKKLPFKHFLRTYITNEDSLHKIKDKYTIQMNKEFKGEFSHNHRFPLTKKEVEDLLAYLKQ